MQYEKQLKYVGNSQQLFSFKQYRLEGGKAQGVLGADISNGNGLDVTILPDRGMDIYQVRLNGKNLNYITPTGICAPQFYDTHGDEFLRNYFAGFLTTCGLSSIGKPSIIEGVEYGLHGRIANTPAEGLSLWEEQNEGNPVVHLKGTMREAVLFGEYLSLTREITIPYMENTITITDKVKNHRFTPSGHMILYHFNMGYPMLSEDTILHIPTAGSKTREGKAAEKSQYERITPPAVGYEEQVYYHKPKIQANGLCGHGCFNPKQNVGVFFESDPSHLGEFIQWNMFGAGEYVLGLELANAKVDSRKVAKEDGTLKYLGPGEEVTYRHKISFVDTQEQFEDFCKTYSLT